MTGTLYSAVWHPGNYPTDWSTGLEADDFVELKATREDDGWRLMRARSVKIGAKRRWSGVWHKGPKGESRLLWKLSLDRLENDHDTQRGKGRAMVDLHTYLVGKQRYWCGVFRPDDEESRFLGDVTWATVKTEVKKRKQKGWRMARIQPYLEGDVRRYAVLFRPGTGTQFADDYRFSELGPAVVTQMGKGRHLVDLEPYWDDSELRYLGVWREGPNASMWRVVEHESLRAVARLHFKDGFRIQSLSSIDYPCDCMNQAVEPASYEDDNGKTVSHEPYDRRILCTSTHRDGPPGTGPTPKKGQRVAYRAPVDVDPETEERFLRVDSIAAPAQFLRLPFTDEGVKRSSIWRYKKNGRWHHNGDYNKGGKTFKVVASAPGRVIYIGWHEWSGNAMVLSHDVGGVEDSYRTLYLHLRNGATNDAEAAWSQSVPPLSGSTASNYKELLTKTGIPEKGERSPDPDYWGTDDQVIDTSLLSKKVKAGTFLAWAGCTGPGGQRKYDDPNTHLHIGWARRDPTDGRWYLFDPYGIYGRHECYPKKVTDPLGPCARFGSAWKGGTPSYPAT